MCVKKNLLLTIKIETASLKLGSPPQQRWFKSFVFGTIYVIKITISSVRVDAVPLLGSVDPQGLGEAPFPLIIIWQSQVRALQFCLEP
jgi:hypothetical protein